MFSAHVQTIGMVLKLTVGSCDPTHAVFSVGCGEAPEPCGPHPVARPRIHRWLYGVPCWLFSFSLSLGATHAMQPAMQPASPPEIVRSVRWAV